ncbi:acetolactate synthase [Streptomyces umbrinus]|uniref:thiamine pyrophosphate-binding protein n=1 Tax=Streptomyces umbrinus TaxID=67370 RepID=UPI0016789643|nr:thiamine pyrophosphate-binding protein [Streptomyces umbrinus]GHB59123.1 acetolactate synthase [Streptomyces umbrinus]
MADNDEGGTRIDGEWDLTWRPAMIPPQSAVVTLTRHGDALTVRSDGVGSPNAGEGTVEGRRLSWTVGGGEVSGPLRFEAEVEGDLLLGHVDLVFGPRGERAPLEGVRAGSGAQVPFREGSDAIAATLTACGVEYVFGYSGGMAQSLERSIIAHGINDMAARGELAAAWMSYGYNRVKRRAASATLMWCVGSMHASPVVYAAKLDSTPLVFMLMESAAAWDMRDQLQDATELYSAFKPLSKYIKRVVDGEDLPLAVRQAVLAASTGKFGPAVLDLTHGAMHQKTTVKTEKLTLPEPPAASEAAVRRTLELIEAAERPVVLVGAGVHLADAAAELREFVETTGIPVVSSGPGGRGVLPDDHPLWAGDMSSWGYFGTGTKIAEDADLWVAIGFSFSQTATMSWSLAKPENVVHVDIEQSQLGRIFQPTLGVVADAKAFLGQLNGRLQTSGQDNRHHDDVTRPAEIARAKDSYTETLRSFVGTDPIMPAAIGQVLADEVPAGTILVNDEGFMVPGMVFREEKYPSGFRTPLGFHYASMGSSLPVAIGAKLAAPDRLVVSVGGDGGFYYSCGELSTLAEHNLKVISIVLNNGGLYGGRRGRAHGGPGSIPVTHWSDFPDTDFTAVAQGMGVPGERVEKADQLTPAIQRAIAADGPYFIEVLTSASTLHLYLAGWPDPEPRTSRKAGHGDRFVEGSWPN